MKARTIKAVIRKKIDEWLASITDEPTRELAKKNTIVTGGCIASMLLAEKVNDFDLYFRDHATTKAIADYYVQQFNDTANVKFKNSGHKVEIHVDDRDGRIQCIVKSAGIASEEGADNYQYFEAMEPDSTEATEYAEAATQVLNALNDPDKPKYRPVFLSSNAITLSTGIQLITRFYGDPDEIHANFDFDHCKNYWTSWDSALTLNPKALEALLAKELRYSGSKYPICSIIRTRKFITRGWTINAGQYLKMAMQCHDLDLNNLVVLKDQLTGVDAAYFLEIISALKEKGGERFDTAYLVEIIDRMF